MKVVHEVTGGRPALHLRHVEGRTRLAAVESGSAAPELDRVLARAVARVGGRALSAWPDAVALAPEECLAKNAARGAHVTSLAYLGVATSEDEVRVSHAGDLRGCLLEEGEPPRWTRDHSTKKGPARCQSRAFFISLDLASLSSVGCAGGIDVLCTAVRLIMERALVA